MRYKSAAIRRHYDTHDLGRRKTNLKWFISAMNVALGVFGPDRGAYEAGFDEAD